jgi:mono/diheme cytochrome c family protein
LKKSDPIGGFTMGEEMKQSQWMLAAVAMSAALWGGSAWAAGGDSAKGRAVFEKHCAACHGAQGKGDGPTGAMLTPKPADLTSAATAKKSDADLRTIIENGKPPTAMIGWKGQLSDGEIGNVLAYVRSLGK